MLVDVLNSLDFHPVEGGQDRGQHSFTSTGQSIQKDDLISKVEMPADHRLVYVLYLDIQS
jgi:hypothetical protein